MAQLALIGGIVAGVSGIASGVMAIRQGRAQADAYEQTAAYNAKAAQIETSVAEARLRREQARRQARLRASIAGRGIALEGSPLEIMADSAAAAEEEALLIRYMGGVKASQILYEGSTSATFAKSRGLAEGLGSIGQGAGTILGSVGKYGEGTLWGGASEVPAGPSFAFGRFGVGFPGYTQ